MPRVSAAHEQEVRDRILGRRGPCLQREGLPRRDDRRRRPRERPVGRGHLHVLHRQGRAVPPGLRPDRGPRARRAGRPARRRPRPPPSGWRSPSASTSRPSTTYDGDAGPGLARPGLGRGGPRARRARRCSPAGGSGSSAPARCCSTRASPAASCRPGSTWTPSRAASSPSSTACCSSGSRPATPTARPTCERRAAGHARASCCAAAPGRDRAPGAGPDGVASRPWPTSRPSSARSSRRRSGSPCRTSTPRSRCGTSRTAGTTGS